MKSNELFKRIFTELQVVKGPDARGNYTAWCPFHPDGQGNPPHQPDLSIHPEKGFYCFACKEKGSLRRLAKKLGVEMNTQSDNFEATYDYRDTDGKLLFQVVRKRGKKFFVRKPDSKGGWKNELGKVKRVLYRLPELMERTGEPVFIVEGEKDADRLHSLGLLATTNVFGAGSWKPQYSEYLKGRDVIILPDNDKIGQEHADQVAKFVIKLASSVKVVELPGLNEHGDVSDWLDAGNTVDDLKSIVESTVCWKPTKSKTKADSSNAGDSKETDLNKLLRIIDESEVYLFKDQSGNPHMGFDLNGRRTILSMDPKVCDKAIRQLAFSNDKFIPNSNTLKSAIQHLSSRASFGSITHPLHVRLAEQNGIYWLDLNGSSAVRLSESGWNIVDKQPYLFRSYPHQKPIPDPAGNGDPLKIFDYINIPDKESRILLLPLLILGLIPKVKRPLLIFFGPEGSGKSSGMEFIKRLLDPSEVSMINYIPDKREFYLFATQSSVMFYNNMQEIPDWLSRNLCVMVDGGSNPARLLYTNTEIITGTYDLLVGFNGIPFIAELPDLIDRALIFELRTLARNKYRLPEVMDQDFAKDHPSILGGLLNLLVKAIPIKRGFESSRLPRMGQYAVWGAAIAEVLGVGKERFLQIYEEHRTKYKGYLFENNDLAVAVAKLMEKRSEWHGIATSLKRTLDQIAKELGIDTRQSGWPRSNKAVVRELQKIKNLLAIKGITFDEGKRHSDARPIILRNQRVANLSDDDKSNRNDNRKRNIVIPKAASEATYDDNDDNDDVFNKKFNGMETDEKERWTFEQTKLYELQFEYLVNVSGLSEEEAEREASESVREYSRLKTYSSN